ncbi:MAG: glycosyltransferase family 9 protein [Bdellovibrionales bacterium]|nr:glycosyltransferase family 9 protein [Bdellovibrionales bacterium]
MSQLHPKVLVFRFSSFGDVLQSLSIAGCIKEQWKNAEIHFCTREDFVPLFQSHSDIQKVWSISKKGSWRELIHLAQTLRAENWTHIYDCHNNLRSRVICYFLNGFLGFRKWIRGHQFLRRPIYRWKRFLLFRFRWNLFPKPFSGQGALLKPLEKWGLRAASPSTPQLYFSLDFNKEVEKKLKPQFPQKFVALAPSAAFLLKRWPLNYFKEVIQSMAHIDFVILGGPEDTFASELVEVAPERVFNWIGQLSLLESAWVVAQSTALVANDTGLMHVAEQVGRPCVALMGPAPFGFPSRVTTRVLERELDCRPCSKHGQGPCINKETYQKCLVDILPAEVIECLKAFGVDND